MKTPYHNYAKDKGILFFSVPSPQFLPDLMSVGVKDYLASFHYIRKQKTFFVEWLHKIKEDGGYFMTDSGAFSILNAGIKDVARTEEYWLPYIDEYVQFLWDHKHLIYVCANMDLDTLVGRDTVDRWNEKYFEPLEKATNVIYLAHKDVNREYGDINGFKRLKEYCARYDYVGVNNNWSKDVKKVAVLARTTNTRIHGFALTSQNSLVQSPFFSHDSSTWSVGIQYGSTFRAVGKRVWRVEKDLKHTRRAQQRTLEEAGVDFRKLIDEDDRSEVNKMNAFAWLAIRRNYLKSANVKLNNKPAKSYDLRGDH